jgi:hypothetical protein
VAEARQLSAKDRTASQAAPTRRKRLATFVGGAGVVSTPLLALVLFGSTATSTGCQGKQCEGDFLFYGEAPGEGSLIDEDTWQSSPIDGFWLEYRPARIFLIRIPAFRDRLLVRFEAYISPAPDPNRTLDPGEVGDNFALAAGNLAEFSQVGRGAVNVRNATCAEYYLRLVVHAEPRRSSGPEPDEDAGDGGVDASEDGGVSDGGDGGDGDGGLEDAGADG